MPEGVEVSLTALWLNDKFAGKQITEIKIEGGRYIRHTLKGKDYVNKYKPTINKIDSKGKFMWFEMLGTDNKFYYLLNRFGLTGMWSLNKQDHSNVELIIEGESLYFIDSRNFGTIDIIDNKNILNQILNKLAPDVLKTKFTYEDFNNMIKKIITKKDGKINKTGNKKIVEILMSQTTLFSGIGNYLSVEILYKSKISPHKKLADIYNDQKLVVALTDAIKYIVKVSFMTADVGYFDDLDPTMLIFVKGLRNKNNDIHPDVVLQKNDKFKFNVYRQKKDPLGNDVIGDTIIKDRTTYWCPSIQT